MDFNTNTATALLSALRLAREHGGAEAALRSTGIDLPDIERFEGAPDDLVDVLDRSSRDKSVEEALALGLIAGRVAHRPRTRTAADPTSFVMDRDLVVQGAEGESILRLPWFEDELFVGRQLPDISEMPPPVLRLCIENYSAALTGERGRFAFVSYGHAYSVDAVPVRGDDGGIEAVLAIATPTPPYVSAAAEHERTAERLDRFATSAEERAVQHGRAGRTDAQVVERQAAQKARRTAERAWAHARSLRFRSTAAGALAPPSATPREIEVLQLASHGLTYAGIAEQLGVSVTTIRTHFENLYAKLGVCDKAAAVAAALRHGLIE